MPAGQIVAFLSYFALIQTATLGIAKVFVKVSKGAASAHAVAAEDERVRVAVEYRRQHRPLDVFNVVLAPARVSRQHDARKRPLLAHQPQFLRQRRGAEREHHDERQDYRKDLLHMTVPP